ncbi:MAG: LicD family protein [archaeon]|nr:LicD family protein [archaeon]
MEKEGSFIGSVSEDRDGNMSLVQTIKNIGRKEFVSVLEHLDREHGCNGNTWMLYYHIYMDRCTYSDMKSALEVLERFKDTDAYARFQYGRMKVIGVLMDRDLAEGFALMKENMVGRVQRTAFASMVYRYRFEKEYPFVRSMADGERTKGGRMAELVCRHLLFDEGDVEGGMSYYGVLSERSKVEVVRSLVYRGYPEELVEECLRSLEDRRFGDVYRYVRKHRPSRDYVEENMDVLLEYSPFEKEYLDRILGSCTADEDRRVVFSSSIGMAPEEEYRAFHRMLPPVSETSREYQRINLKVMSDLDSFCRSHDVGYVLSSGSLLGAERNQGFIPWDDDIDVHMFLDDIRRLQRLLDEEGSPYTVETFDGYGRFYKFIPREGFRAWVDLFPLCTVVEKDGVRTYEDHAVRSDGDSKVEYTFPRDTHLEALKCRFYGEDDLFPLREVGFEGHRFLAPNVPSAFLSHYGEEYLRPPRSIHRHISDDAMSETVLKGSVSMYTAEGHPEKAVDVLREAVGRGVPGASATLFNILWDMDDPGTYGEMASIAKGLSDRNDGTATFRLARMYLEGKGVGKDPKAAEELFRKAVKLKVPGSKTGLFEALRDIGDPSSYPEMVRILKSLCDMGNGTAMVRLARMMYEGKGMEKDLFSAEELLRKAVGKNASGARPLLFEVLRDIDDPGTYDEMFGIAREQADKGDGLFTLRLARMYRDGKGVEKDLNSAMYLMRRAVSKNVPNSRIELFDVLWDCGDESVYPEMIGLIEPLLKDNPKAILRYAKACHLGKGVPKDLGRSAEMYSRVCKGSEQLTCEYFDILLKIGTEDALETAKAAISQYSGSKNPRVVSRLEKCKGF